VAIRGIRNQQDDRPLPPFAPVEAPAPPLRLDELIVDPPDIDLTSTPAAERYSAWADRLRDKRRRDQARIRGDQADGAGGSHWNADTVIGRPGEHEFSTPGLPVPSSEVAARLGVLGLEPGATPEQINLAYRRLAKVHHPDRWAEADEATQRHHSEAMLRINGAYRALSTPQIA
jgi:DnaJ-domain-containing protein 1